MKIKDLAEELEVKERMVRIYKEEIEKAGIIINSETGVDGGYSIENSTLIPTVNFTKNNKCYE